MLRPLSTENVAAFVLNHVSFRSALENCPSLPDNGRSLTDNSCDALRSGYRTFVSQRRSDLEGFLRASDTRLQPFADPLRSDLLFAPILADKREESYSAVLDWLIHRVPAHKVLQVFGIDDDAVEPSLSWQSDREYLVRLGRDGRLDLVLSCSGRCRLTIEVKTRSYTEQDLLKHDLYCAAIRARPEMRESAKVFVALQDEGYPLHGFTFRSWKQVCLELRRNARAVIDTRPYGEAALFLALLGALEQNLLEIHPGLPNNAPRLVNYLKEYLEGGESNAN